MVEVEEGIKRTDGNWKKYNLKKEKREWNYEYIFY